MMKYDANHGVTIPQHLRGMFYTQPLAEEALGARAGARIAVGSQVKVQTQALHGVRRLDIARGLQRLYFGAAIRSVRTGCASVLYFTARNFSEELCSV